MRGAPRYAGEHRVQRRIIPAYAGSTVAAASALFYSWDHPRVCGEHTRWPRRSGTRGDHPRVCGEHTLRSKLNGETEGSSPRMRGARRRSECPRLTHGIIPAYAGSTQSCRPLVVMGRDHPRVCGEHPSCSCCNIFALGSSPRMRGAPRAEMATLWFDGIIPAYEGSTAYERKKLDFGEDHPRVCGEHRTQPCRCIANQGSSPRMRGAPFFAPPSPIAAGIIPAYAGSTCHELRRLRKGWDHPRVCGEHD